MLTATEQRTIRDRPPARSPHDACVGPWVVIPTYNEVENLTAVVSGVTAALRAAARPFCVLIVDDGSPDGTGRLADALAVTVPELRVLHRPGKEGLGAAYVAGFRAALRAGATHVVQMDADQSHDPATVPDLIAACEAADLAIGSRYVAGGSTPGWKLGRRLLSRSGCLYAAAWLGLPVRDLTGGFKCWRRGALERVGLAAVDVCGHGFQIEMTYRAVRNGCRVVEVPIRFRDREHGTSKLAGGIVREALVAVPRLRLSSRDRSGAPTPAAPSRRPSRSV